MGKVKIGTISIVSSNDKELNDKINEILKNDSTSDRIYEVGKRYKPTKNLIAADINIYLGSDLIYRHKILSEFEKDGEGTAH